MPRITGERPNPAAIAEFQRNYGEPEGQERPVPKGLGFLHLQKRIERLREQEGPVTYHSNIVLPKLR